MERIIKDEVSLVLSGEAGQGIQTIEKFLTRILKREGLNVYATKEYMSRIRGGDNSTQIRVSSNPVRNFIDRIDILIPLTSSSVNHLEKRISENTIIIGDNSKLKLNIKNLIDIPIFSISKEIGGSIYSNIVAVGLIMGIFDLDKNNIKDYMNDLFGKKSDEIINNNILAAEKGFEKGLELRENKSIRVDIKKEEKIKEHLLINGSEAIAFGSLLGGCNSIFTYPMTPGTGALLALAEYSNKFDILVEQAEDEIAAVNMAIGGWYAGARPLVTTSGGGFALMTEGVSLSGMTEIPLVVHIAQRPGPATGLPTRTAQEDLNLVLYAGHGEFPRAIYAPGDIEDAIYLTKEAFEISDKYQIPTFILTDQYFVDSYYNIEKFDFSNSTYKNHIVETQEHYKRYKLSDNPISPRGIPGYGEGIVVIDSDEHDEEGHITENLDIRIKMNNKRNEKLNLIKENALQPELIGDKNFDTLIITWGSNKNVVKEAINIYKNKNISQLHFNQVYPLGSETNKYLEKAKTIICVENNYNGQFSNLLIQETGFDINKKILKYDGIAFSTEDIINELKKIN